MFVLAAILGLTGFSRLSAQELTRVSVDSAGMQGNSMSEDAAISEDGRLVVFASPASNLVPGDTNGFIDVFVHDRQSGLTTRVSVSSAGIQGNAYSSNPSISGDGRFVAFASDASNLVTGDTNGRRDAFVHDLRSGQTTLVSVDSSGVQGNDHCIFTPSISGDGRLVAFASTATNLVLWDTNRKPDVFVHDRQTGRTSRVSVNSAGLQGNGISNIGWISGDGRAVVFHSWSDNLVAGDTNGILDLFVHELESRQTTRVSVNSAGVQGNGMSSRASLSRDGRFVAFESTANNLVVGDANGRWDAFVHDRQTGQTTLVSVNSAGVQGNWDSFEPSISRDGDFVAFDSTSTNLVAGDTNGTSDVFVHDLRSGQVILVSADSAGVQGNSESGPASISWDGRCVAFESLASNLVSGDTNSVSDVFVHERPGLSLTLTGTCPGPVTLTVTHATPGGAVVMIHGEPGSSIRIGSPCTGLIIPIRQPALAGILRANGSGVANYPFNSHPGLCGRTIVGVDVGSCKPTNTVIF